MKKQIYTIVGLIIVMTVLTVTTTFAQSAKTVKVHIPFDFSVRNQTIAAGDYVIKQADDRGAVWSLRSMDNGQQMFLLAWGIESKSSLGISKLTFHRYGNKYFLTAIETPAYQIGLQKSRAERSLQKSLTQKNRLAKNNVNGATPEIVAIEIAM